MTELLALVLALTSSDSLTKFWLTLTNTSVVTQSVAIISAAVLCSIRPWLMRLNLNTPLVTVMVYSLIQIVTIMVTLFTLWLTLWLVTVNEKSIGLAEYGLPLGRNFAISSIVTLMALRYFYVQHQWKQNVEAEARARLWALQARIHPHFLFNTLNTIASLIRTRPEQAEQIVLDLADLLRSALASLERITLGEELELTRRYLAIESLRMGERLQVEWQLDDDLALDMPLPALLLQPLVENAIHHGIQALPEGGRLVIRIEKQPAALRFTIANPCPPAGSERFAQGQRLAQDNIRQRLLLLYGAASRLEIAETADGYRVAFTVPLAE